MRNDMAILDDNKRPKLYSTNELADACGVTARTVRFYESKGLLNPQLAGATRVYTYRERARMELIQRGKRLGFSLDEISEYLDLYDADSENIDQILYIWRKSGERIAELKNKLDDLQATHQDITAIENEAYEKLIEKGVTPKR